MAFSQDRQVRKQGLAQVGQLIKTQKNKALLEVYYKKELYKRLLFIVTEDGVSNHREQALE